MAAVSELPAEEIKRVAIVGAGAAGREFAASCLRAGFEVVLEDVMPANLRRAEEELSRLSGRLTLALTVEDAVREADLAIDFVPDELESKLEIFSMVDRMAPPRTILCTPTEILSITDLASCVYRPERCFAVGGLPLRRAPADGARLRLVHGPAALPGPLVAVRFFLTRLDFKVEVLADPEAPMLVKNLA